MGWTGTHATHYKNGKVDRKAECDEDCTFENDKVKSRVLKSSMVGTVYYAAVEQIRETGREVFAAVFLTSGQDKNDPYFNFHYKDMTEHMGPFECKCPVSILNMLTPTDNETANSWRAKCRAYNEKKKTKQTPGTLPVGTQIRFTRWDGKEYVIEKKSPAYQFRRNWWYVPETHTAYPSRYIPENFEIIKKGA